MNDDDLRRSAQRARRRELDSTDVDGALADARERIESGALPTPTSSAPPAPRHWSTWAAAAAALAMVVGVVVVASGVDDDSTIRTIDTPIVSTAPTDPSVPATEPSPSSAPTSTPAATAVPATEAPPATSAPPSPAQTVMVSYDDPPPLVEPVVIASIPLEPNPNGSTVSVAIGENEIAVSQPNTRTVTLVGYRVGAGVETARRTVELDEMLFDTALGPGDVLYGFGDDAVVEGRAYPDLRFVAIPLSGDRQGTVVSERRVPVIPYTELPPAVFGHGPDGVVDRARDINSTIIEYVDVAGAPLEWGGDSPRLLASEWFPDGTGRSVSVVGSDLAWKLVVTPDPTNGGSYVGPSPPAPTSAGRVVYSENIGRDLTPGQDFGPSAMPVVAVLEPDGSGRWVRLPDGWSVVSSDVWGTVLARTTATTLELALLDDVVAPS